MTEKCRVCDTSCGSCLLDSLKTCTTCVSNQFYLSKPDLELCQRCPANCNTCEFSSSLSRVICLDCSAGYIYDNINQDCRCPDGYYMTKTVGLTCELCNAKCLTC